MSALMTCILANRYLKRKSMGYMREFFIYLIRIGACFADSVTMAVLAALMLIPMAHKERGYWAVGGEWFLVMGVFFGTFLITNKIWEKEDMECGRERKEE